MKAELNIEQQLTDAINLMQKGIYHAECIDSGVKKSRTELRKILLAGEAMTKAIKADIKALNMLDLEAKAKKHESRT